MFTRGRLGEEVWGSKGRELPAFLAEVYPRQKSITRLRSLENPSPRLSVNLGKAGHFVVVLFLE